MDGFLSLAISESFWDFEPFSTPAESGVPSQGASAIVHF
jgi:hypothetical protein